MKFILSMPPSINNTYAVSRTQRQVFYKKKAVKEWEVEAGWQIKSQQDTKQDMFMKDVYVLVTWFYDHPRDIDAGIKVLLDVFQKQRIYLNDTQVTRLHLEKYIVTHNPRVEVEIEEIYNP